MQGGSLPNPSHVLMIDEPFAYPWRDYPHIRMHVSRETLREAVDGDEGPPASATVRQAERGRPGLWFGSPELDTAVIRMVRFSFAGSLIVYRGVVVDADDALCMLLEMPAERILGQACDSLILPHESDPGAVGGLEAGGGRRAVVKRAKSDRLDVWVFDAAVCCHGRAARLVALRPTVADAGPRLVPALASSCGRDPSLLMIAHDLSNLLTVVSCGLTLAARQGAEEPDKKVSILHDAQAACGRSFALVRELMSRALGFVDAPRTESLALVVREVVEEATAGTPVSAEVDLPADLWPVRVVRSDIARVLANLTQNAIQSMAGVGKLKVEARNMHLSGPGAMRLTPGRYVRLSLSDSGVGIPSDMLRHIFDPYFTTRAEGLGLGLTACRGLLVSLGGDITAESLDTHGAAFHVYLQAAARAIPPPNWPDDEPETQVGRPPSLDR